MPDASKEGREVSLAVVQLDYQVTQDLVKMLTDMRFRLLAILPPIAAASIALVTSPSVSLSPLVMLPVGLMGFYITLGMILYDQRNSDLYNACVHRAKKLEGVLGFIRTGNETIKSSPSADAVAMAEGIKSLTRGAGSEDDNQDGLADWPGGPHRQRAVTYFRFLGFDVSHGSALALVYGTLLGAWMFPVTKGVLVLTGDALHWAGCALTFSKGSGSTTSVLSFLVAVIAAYACRRALIAADAGAIANGLYNDAWKGKTGQARDIAWRSAAHRHASNLVSESRDKSYIAALMLCTGRRTTLKDRLLRWSDRAGNAERDAASAAERAKTAASDAERAKTTADDVVKTTAPARKTPMSQEEEEKAVTAAMITDKAAEISEEARRATAAVNAAQRSAKLAAAANAAALAAKVATNPAKAGRMAAMARAGRMADMAVEEADKAHKAARRAERAASAALAAAETVQNLGVVFRGGPGVGTGSAG